MNRKQRRAHAKSKKQVEISEKLTMFEGLPDECLACMKPFDKKDRQMAMTWNVVVRDKNTIRLYCRECWTMATEAVEKFKKEKEK